MAVSLDIINEAYWSGRKIKMRTKHHSPGQWGHWGSSQSAEAADASSGRGHSPAAVQSEMNKETIRHYITQYTTQPHNLLTDTVTYYRSVLIIIQIGWWLIMV